MDNKNIAETVGLVALVLSLVFLGYELKRGNDIAEAEAAATVIGEMNEFATLLVTDDESGRVWSDGLRDYGSLSGKEKRLFRRLLNYALNIFEINIKFMQNGMVDAEYIEYYAIDLCGVVNANEGVNELWRETRELRVRSLSDFVETHCEPPAAE